MIKKALAPLALVWMTGIAHAAELVNTPGKFQVELFGSVDLAVQRLDGGESGNSETKLISAANQTSILGVRGTRALNNDLKIGFWIEGFINLDSGTGGGTSANNQTIATTGQGFVWNRRSTISLSNRFGEVRIGRDWSPTAKNAGWYDPFWGVGVGTATTSLWALRAITFTRPSNVIHYILPPTLGGVFGQAMYGVGETAGRKDGDLYDFRLGFGRGINEIGVGTTRISYTPGVTFGATGQGDFLETNIGGRYDFSVIVLSALYTDQEVKQASGPGTSNRTMKAWHVGAVLPIGESIGGYSACAFKQCIKATYGAGKKTDGSVAAVNGNRIQQLAIGFEYNFDTAAALYATFSRLRNSGGAAQVVGAQFGITQGVNQPSTGIDLGVRYNF
jgi:predicted porin